MQAYTRSSARTRSQHSEGAAEGLVPGGGGRLVGRIGGEIPNGAQTLAARHRRVQFELSVIKLPAAIDRLTAEVAGLRADLQVVLVDHRDAGAE